MSDLRSLFSALGHTDVRTYIQSGNVVFAAGSAQPARIRSAIEASLVRNFGFEVDVLLRTPAELTKVVARNPFGDKAYVTFLDDAPDRRKVEALDVSAYAPDE